MPDAPPTRLHIDPPIDQWRVVPRNGRTKPIIATGHQPTLWHPGILAKDIATDRFAQRVGGVAVHVTVDHNALGSVALDLPYQQGGTLGVRKLLLDKRLGVESLPPNRLPAIAMARVLDGLHQAAAESEIASVRDGLGHLAKAYQHADGCEHLADQSAAVLDALKTPYLQALPMHVSTSSIVTPGFVERLLRDPAGCVRCYNRAVSAYPEARIRPLYLGRDVVEAPLWAQGQRGVSPVYVDLGDSAKPLLFTQDQPLDLNGTDALGLLRPRALSLSAIMRSEHCDLFIHGKGGGVYDQVTERWWQDWIGETLAPKAVVSADVFLPMDVPVATPSERERAVWLDHHLGFNVDRFEKPANEGESLLYQEKSELLDRMNDDRDKRRRAKAFKRIHAINAELRGLHADQLQAVHQQAIDAQQGVANRAIAQRRDWCFALYPDDQLKALCELIEAAAA